MGHWTEEFFVENPDLFLADLENRSESAADEVVDVLDLVANEFDHRPDSVLDAACGTGHHLVEFADRVDAVAGFDVSDRYVEVARERIREAGVGDAARAFQGDLRNVGEFDGQYDLVTLLWNSFGYYGDETNRSILEGLRSRLTEDGVLVMDVASRDAILANGPDDNVVETDDRFIAEEWSYDAATSRYEVDRRLFEKADGDLEYLGRGGWDVRAYSPPEMEFVCETVGFEDVAIFGDFEGSAVTTDSLLVVVAR